MRKPRATQRHADGDAPVYTVCALLVRWLASADRCGSEGRERDAGGVSFALRQSGRSGGALIVKPRARN